jgi:hypothetical protein
VLKRFEMSPNMFWDVMASPPKYYTDYYSYKRRFERFRPVFAILANRNLVPRSFYMKFCFPAATPGFDEGKPA